MTIAEYTAIAQQTINPGETVIFTETAEPCRRGFIRHRDGTGNFLLSGQMPYNFCCRCGGNNSAEYLVNFGANIAIPTGGTPGAISVALQIDSATLPSSIMIVTPVAVEEFFNVSRAINADIWRGCCETVSVKNISDQPILMQNASIAFSRPDLVVTR